MTSYGVELLKRDEDFDTSLTTWFICSPVDMIWETFKKYFSKAHTNLHKMRGNMMQNTPYHLANQAIQKLTKQMRLEILSSVNTLTETHADLFTTIPNDNDTSSLTSSLQLSSTKTLNKVEENSNLSHKDDLFNPLLLVGHLSWPKCLPKRFS